MGGTSASWGLLGASPAASFCFSISSQGLLLPWQSPSVGAAVLMRLITSDSKHHVSVHTYTHTQSHSQSRAHTDSWTTFCLLFSLLLPTWPANVRSNIAVDTNGSTVSSSPDGGKNAFGATAVWISVSRLLCYIK